MCKKIVFLVNNFYGWERDDRWQYWNSISQSFLIPACLNWVQEDIVLEAVNAIVTNTDSCLYTKHCYTILRFNTD